MIYGKENIIYVVFLGEVCHGTVTYRLEEAFRGGAGIMEATERKERETVEPNGTVFAKGLQNAWLKLS